MVQVKAQASPSPKRFLPFLILLAAVAAWWFLGREGKLPWQKPDAESDLTFSGVVEARSTDIAFEATGTLKEILVDEGDTVSKGQVLARLDPVAAQAALDQATARMETATANLTLLRNGPRQAEIDGARARLRQSQADLQQLRNGATAEERATLQASAEAARQRWQLVERGTRGEDIEAARARVESAYSELQTQQKEAQRYRNLYSQGAVSQQVYEAQNNRLITARTNHQAASENLDKLKSGPLSQEREAAQQDYQAARQRYEALAVGTRPELVAKGQATVDERKKSLELLLEGSRPEEIAAAGQRLKEAQAAVRAARDALQKGEMKAPVDGVVTRRSAEVGERVAAGVPVLTTANLKRPWVNIYVEETDLAKVKLGQQARVSADGLAKPVTGKVTYIAAEAEFTPKFIQTKNERTNLVFRTEVTVENQEGTLHPGMPADVELPR